MMDLGVSLGQISVISDGTAAVSEFIIQIFGVIDVALLTLLAFQICSEHLFLMLALSLAYKADIHVAEFVGGRNGVYKLQNCLLACCHVLKQSSEISTALVLSCVIPKYLFLCCSVLRRFCEV